MPYNPNSAKLINIPLNGIADNSNRIMVWDVDANVIQIINTLDNSVYAEIGSSSYKAYSAVLINQSGTDAPTWVELENTLGAPVDWYRDSSTNGTYYAEAYGAFTLGKTVVVPGTLNYDGYLNSSATLVDQVYITTTLSTGLPTDGLLNNTFVEIRVYN